MPRFRLSAVLVLSSLATLSPAFADGARALVENCVPHAEFRGCRAGDAPYVCEDRGVLGELMVGCWYANQLPGRRLPSIFLPGSETQLDSLISETLYSDLKQVPERNPQPGAGIKNAIVKCELALANPGIRHLCKYFYLVAKPEGGNEVKTDVIAFLKESELRAFYGILKDFPGSSKIKRAAEISCAYLTNEGEKIHQCRFVRALDPETLP